MGRRQGATSSLRRRHPWGFLGNKTAHERPRCSALSRRHILKFLEAECAHQMSGPRPTHCRSGRGRARHQNLYRQPEHRPPQRHHRAIRRIGKVRAAHRRPRAAENRLKIPGMGRARRAGGWWVPGQPLPPPPPPPQPPRHARGRGCGRHPRRRRRRRRPVVRSCRSAAAAAVAARGRCSPRAPTRSRRAWATIVSYNSWTASTACTSRASRLQTW